MELLFGWVIASFILFGLTFASLLPVFLFIMFVSWLIGLSKPRKRRDD